MDFPKSVPGVGLVGGQFVDENPSVGQQGSLIPSAWGNAVTQELLNVIQAAGLTPDEAQTNQLLQAIRTLVPERTAFARTSGTVTLPDSSFGISGLADGGSAATVTLPAVGDLAEDTELLLFADHSNVAAIRVKAATGDAVQGPGALMDGSNTAFMLSAGGDWVRLRSEKALGRWVVACCFTNARISTLEARQLALGDGQTRKLATFVANTVYTMPLAGRAKEVGCKGLTTADNGYIGLQALVGGSWVEIAFGVHPRTSNGVVVSGIVFPGESFRFVPSAANITRGWEVS